MLTLLLSLHVAHAADSAALAAAALKIDAGPEGTTVHHLSNGLTVVLQEDHRTDTVALHLRYGVGSHDELAGERGCAHLFEHLMFEGSRNVGMNKFDEWLTVAGGQNNAYTSDDVTAYHMTFPSGATDLGLFLESDRMAYLLDGVTQVNLDNQRLVVLQERAEGFAAPNGRDWDAVQLSLYPEGHPYHVGTIGTLADVQGFQVDGVKSFWTAHYRPQNAILVLVGNFETDEMLAKVTSWFSEVPDPGPIAARPVYTEPVARHFDGYLEDEVQDRTLYLAWPTVPMGHADQPALEVLSYILSAGRGTRLDDAVYFNSKLASGDGSYSGHNDSAGMFLLYATAPKAPLTKIEAAIEKTVASIALTPPTASELERAKLQLKAGLVDPLETLEDRADWLSECQFYDGKPDCLADRWKAYEAVTVDDLVRVSQKYLTNDRRISVSTVPTGDGGQLPGAVAVEIP